MSVDPLVFAKELPAAGVPVVVCRPNRRWRPGSNAADVIPPTGWNMVTAQDCDLSKFRAGVDTLAMVAGHGADVVDVDTKACGSLDGMPPFKSFGRVRTPSGGFHDYVRSTGVGKISQLDVGGHHVGDYVGGTKDGGSRLLGFLPGSTRPKYPGGDDTSRSRSTSTRWWTPSRTTSLWPRCSGLAAALTASRGTSGGPRGAGRVHRLVHDSGDLPLRQTGHGGAARGCRRCRAG